MATLLRDVTRPAFLDPPAEGQLSLVGVSSPSRERGREGRRGRDERGREPVAVPLSERLRREQTAATQAGTARGGGTTLDELLVGAWEGLAARRTVACPVCAQPMQPRAAAPGGACGDCGTQLR